MLHAYCALFVDFYDSVVGKVHLSRLSSSGTELVCEGLFSHPNEIWDLASCPFDQRIFSTVFSSGESHGAAISKIPELYGELNSPQLEKIASLYAHKSKPKCFLLGTVFMHPKWSLGYHQCRYSYDSDERVREVSFQVGDALNQPFPDGEFDLVWSMESGEHMPNKKKFVSELARVAAPGATIILVTWCHKILSPSEESLRPDEEKLLDRICDAYYLPAWCSASDYVKLMESFSLQEAQRYAQENGLFFMEASED